MITYLDLIKWFNENGEKINNSIIRDIFSIGDAYVFEIYKKDLDKKYLYIVPEKIIFLSNNKLEKTKNKFVERLKKDFLNKKMSIFLEDDKIVRLEIGEKKIYAELLPQGVIVVTDNSNKILYANRYKNFGYRNISPGEIYRKPLKNFSLPREFGDFLKVIEKSDKRDIVRCLAIDFGLSKKYAEYILEKVKIDKNKPIKELSNEEIRKIYEEYLSILERKEVLYEDKWYDKINDLFEEIYFRELIEEKKRKIDKKKEELTKIIKNQEETLKKMKEEYEKMLKLANIIRENYWIFEGYDITKIKELINSLNLQIEVEKKDYKIIVDLRNNNIGKN